MKWPRKFGRHITTGSPYDINYATVNDITKLNSSVYEKLSRGRNGVLVYKNRICFEELVWGMRAGDKYSHIIYKCKFAHRGKWELSKEEIRWWIGLCQEEKLLLTELPDDFCTTGNAVIEIGDRSMPDVYIDICCIRYLQENPNFIRAVQWLMVKNNVGFYTALFHASKHFMTGYGHHIIRINIYSGRPVSGKIDLSYMRKFYNFIHDRREEKFNGPEGFGLHAATEKVSVDTLLVKEDDLFKEETEAAIRTLY